ncbi:response regulator transcription factor [soil metagenome]
MRLLVVEDDLPIATGLQRALQREGYLVDLSSDGRSALNVIGESNYDCVILDLGLPDIDGTDVLRQLRRQKTHVPVVILSARDETADRVLGLDLGADDYIVKPFELDELGARIRAVMRRAVAKRGDAVEIGDLRLSSVDRRVFMGDEPLELSPREFAVLECLLMRHGRVVSKRQLLDSVDGWDSELSGNAVELYVHRVRKKIERSSCSIQTLRGFGYLLEVDATH